MYRAAARGDTEKVERMLKQGVNIEFTLFGWTPLMVACSKGHMWEQNSNDVVKMLIAKGAKLEAADNGEKGYKRALHLACQYGGPDGSPEIVDTLLKAGAELEAESDDQWRPLHYAVFFGHLEIVKLLLERGADVGAMTLLGKTPLIIAKEKRMRSELYEEKQMKILRRDAILELLASKPQPVSEYLYQLESYFPA
jgi:ankyrin repeat protein